MAAEARGTEDPPRPKLCILYHVRNQNWLRIGFDADRAQLKSRDSNMLSATEQAQLVEAYLHEEVRSGRITSIGSTEEAKHMNVHCSPFGVIPK